jgi:hypothetical protein
VANPASQSAVSRGDGDASLPGQAGVNSLVMATASVELGQHGSWDHDICGFGQSGHKGGPHGVLVGTAAGQQ